MELRFFFSLPDEIKAKAGSLAEKYAPESEHYYVVNNKNFVPHITLCTTSLDERVVQDGAETVRAFLSLTPIPELHAEALEMGGDGTLWVRVTQSPEVMEFRNAFLDFIDSAFGNVLRKGNTYHPHITLTKFRSVDDGQKIVERETFEQFSFTPRAVGYGFCDDPGAPLDGQIEKISGEFFA